MSNIRQEVENLLKQVLDMPFELCWCGDCWWQGYNRRPEKIHLTDEVSDNEIKQIALHEATHSLLGRGGHDEEFWELLEKLVHDYLGVELDEHQSKMKQDYLKKEPNE